MTDKYERRPSGQRHMADRHSARAAREQMRTVRAQPTAVGPERRGPTRAQRNRDRRGRRRTAAFFVVTAFLVVAVGAVFLGSKLWHSTFGEPSDFSGEGKEDVVVQVHPGDTTTVIAETLAEANVVATVRTFLDAAQGNSALASIQPGFYKVRTEIPAADAVTRLVNPQNRVGKLVIPEGRQLDDTRDVKTNIVTDGILTLISKASCVTLDGKENCVTADALLKAAQNGTPTALQVPSWAVDPVTAMGTDHRRLEGLIAPGSWNIDPSATPIDILGTLVGASAAKYAESGLLDTAKALNMTPYEILIVASLVQRESTPADFPKVARVIYNRLQVGQKLEFDSTVNYALDRQEIATTDEDRARETPWNTYAKLGLPLTPICSPSAEALTAAERPAEGDWLYFVTVDLDGTTKFTRDYQQHLANIEIAQRNGVLDSSR